MENLEPKEKAEEIYNKMKGFRISNRHRMKCALVTVDEVLKELKDNHDYSKCMVEFTFWEKVKAELLIIKDGFPPIKRKQNGNS